MKIPGVNKALRSLIYAAVSRKMDLRCILNTFQNLGHRTRRNRIFQTGPRYCAHPKQTPPRRTPTPQGAEHNPFPRAAVAVILSSPAPATRARSPKVARAATPHPARDSATHHYPCRLPHYSLAIPTHLLAVPPPLPVKSNPKAQISQPYTTAIITRTRTRCRALTPTPRRRPGMA
jgi:hypothetical protein